MLSPNIHFHFTKAIYRMKYCVRFPHFPFVLLLRSSYFSALLCRLFNFLQVVFVAFFSSKKWQCPLYIQPLFSSAIAVVVIIKWHCFFPQLTSPMPKNFELMSVSDCDAMEHSAHKSFAFVCIWQLCVWFFNVSADICLLNFFGLARRFSRARMEADTTFNQIIHFVIYRCVCLIV